MSSRISQQQLESYLWGAATLLRGTIDAGDYKQFIFPLLFYKRLCDVFDEETQTALKESGGDKKFAAYSENHRFQVPTDAHWREVRKTAKNVGNALQSGMRAIETANPDKLYGIFGDAQWTNKDRLSDSMLRDLIEHFSTFELTVANLSEDALGQGYEYLIKKFADDSGHTAAEFYTNRTVVHMMTEMLEPQPGESIYDPTCGSGGMLLSCIAHLRRQKKEWRNVRLYGQERNLMTSSIARMNCFLHGIEDFQIVRGDTLSEPKLVQGDRLMRFDVCLANPPYSIKQWDRGAFASDPWGRNLYGTPPQGRADYAFWQHILCSLEKKTGRCAILFPHGVLFRQEETDMRRRLIEADLIECVLGLGPNLFYNSPMEACVVICRATKPKTRKGRVLLINAVNEVTRERAQSFLTDDHIERIVKAYQKFKDESGFTHVASLEELRTKDFSLSIPLYVEGVTERVGADVEESLAASFNAWLKSQNESANALARILPNAALPIPDLPLSGNDTCELLNGRTKWTRVHFGDVVENLNETEKNPVEVGLERYIGLEHLEPGSLHVRSWGEVADGTTFTRRCRPGQVLFGKRRAYQRKVAVAEFNAVVSGDIYVFASKRERLLPELLPFVCLSEQFFQYAVGTSAGSLSPRTNWSSLANFEFDLPSIDQQCRVTEIFSLMYDSVDSKKALIVSLNEYLDATSHSQFERLRAHNISMGDLIRDGLVDLQTGPFGTVLSATSYTKTGVPVINPVNMNGDSFDTSAGPFISSENAKRLDRYEMQLGDIVMCRKRHVGRMVEVSKEHVGFIVGSDCIRIRAKQNHLLSKFLLLYLRSSSIQRWLVRATIGSVMPGMNEAILSKLNVPVPPIDVQEQVAESLGEILNAIEVVRKDVTRILQSVQALQGQVFAHNSLAALHS